jgi:hypothetical protein
LTYKWDRTRNRGTNDVVAPDARYRGGALLILLTSSFMNSLFTSAALVAALLLSFPVAVVVALVLVENR